MTTADPISIGGWATEPELAHPGAGEYPGRHRHLLRSESRATFTLRRLFYVARHRRR